jgi:hypothetical protein
MVGKSVLEAELNVPNHVAVPSGAKTLDIDVLATLRNTGEDTRVVHASNSGDVHFWQLLDENHREVQRSPKAPSAKALENARSEAIAGGHAFAEPTKITLDAGKLKEGRRYILQYKLWDEHIAQGSISFTRAATRPKAKAKAKSAAKRKRK